MAAEELAGISDRVLDLARRALRACTEKLATVCSNGIVGLLPEVPSANDPFELPSLPELSDAKAVEAWSEAIVRLSYERGESSGRREGRQEGREEGLREGQARGRARAIVDVLNRRGFALTELQSTRILVCRDEATLARWWDLAWSVSSVDELWG